MQAQEWYMQGHVESELLAEAGYEDLKLELAEVEEEERETDEVCEKFGIDVPRATICDESYRKEAR